MSAPSLREKIAAIIEAPVAPPQGAPQVWTKRGETYRPADEPIAFSFGVGGVGFDGRVGQHFISSVEPVSRQSDPAARWRALLDQFEVRLAPWQEAAMRRWRLEGPEITMEATESPSDHVTMRATMRLVPPEK